MTTGLPDLSSNTTSQAPTGGPPAPDDAKPSTPAWSCRPSGSAAHPCPGCPSTTTPAPSQNESGRVIRDSSPVPGSYVAGWLKRGPSGIIGTNKPDGTQTAAAVLEDLAERLAEDRPDILELLASRSSEPVDWAGWLRLEEHEGALGPAEGRGRVKVHNPESMLRHCSAVPV